MKKVVFSGGTYCGKTTLLNHFASEGFSVVPETGIVCITKLVEEMGLTEYKKWRANNQQEFFDYFVKKQEEIEHQFAKNNTDSGFVFYDRSFADLIAMCRHAGVAVPERATKNFRGSQYDYVFICGTLPNFSQRPETGRAFTKQDSESIGKLVKDVYAAANYNFTFLEPLTLEERVRQIKFELDLT